MPTCPARSTATPGAWRGAVAAWLAAAVFVFAARSTHAQETPEIRVGEIVFEGLLSWDSEDLKRQLSLKVGQPYDQLLEREDLDRLATIMRRVRVLREPMQNDRIRLTFVVQEFPRLRKLQSIGNRSISDERIEAVARLEPGDIIDNNVVESLRRALLSEYRAMGLTSAEVQVNVSIVLPRELEPGTAPRFSQADLHVVVDEGERILVDDLVIEGNDAYLRIRLSILLETKGSWLFIKNYYDDRIFEDDLAKLRAFYTSRGYFDVLVERGTFVERYEKGKLIVTPVIKIEEGEKYTLKSVDVRGARLFSRAELLEPFEPLLGLEFDGKKFARALDEAQGLYLDHGFLTTDIRPVYDYDTEGRQLNLTLEVRENERIYVGDIRVSRPSYEVGEAPGFLQRFYERLAPPISDEAIKREVLLEPGEVYNKHKERETLRRLQGLGVFSQVSVINQPTANDRTHDLLISIEEAETGEFFTGVGFGDVGGGFFYASFNERNLFGDARDFRLLVQAGTRASSASVSYTDRYFRGTTDIFSATVFYNQFRREAWREKVVGTNVEVARYLYSEWKAAVRARLEYVDVEKRSGRDPLEDLDLSYPVVSVMLRMSQDTLDPPGSPTEGRKLDGSVEVGWADGPLLKFIGAADYVFPIGLDYSFRFMPLIGLIPYDSDEIGITERFFLGGNEDLRGFDFQGAGRRDPQDEDVPIGGAVKLLVRNELGFPIYEPVSGVFFLDIGTLGGDPFDYETPRASTGLGLRLTMPNRATVAVDFALPLVSQRGDEKRFIHFNFRSSF